MGSALSVLLISEIGPEVSPNSAVHLSMSLTLNMRGGEIGASQSLGS